MACPRIYLMAAGPRGQCRIRPAYAEAQDDIVAELHAEGGPLLVRGTKIGIRLGGAAGRDALVRELGRRIQAVKESLRRDPPRTPAARGEALELDDAAVGVLTHRERLGVITDLMSIRKGLAGGRRIRVVDARGPAPCQSPAGPPAAEDGRRQRVLLSPKRVYRVREAGGSPPRGPGEPARGCAGGPREGPAPEERGSVVRRHLRDVLRQERWQERLGARGGGRVVRLPSFSRRLLDAVRRQDGSLRIRCRAGAGEGGGDLAAQYCQLDAGQQAALFEQASNQLLGQLVEEQVGAVVADLQRLLAGSEFEETAESASDGR